MKSFRFSLGSIALAAIFLSHSALADDAAPVAAAPGVEANSAASGAVGDSAGADRAPASKKKKKKKGKKKKSGRRRHKRSSAATELPQDKLTVASSSEEKAPASVPQGTPDRADSTPAAPAPSTPSSPEAASTATTGSSLKDKIVMSYIAWLTGSHLDAMDGGEGGAPSNLNIDHFYVLGYRFNSNVKVTGMVDITQQIGGTYDAPGQQRALMHDPMLTVSDSHIWESKRYGTNLAGYVRYYVPVGHADTLGISAPGKQKDFGNGMIRVKADPQKTFLDGDLSLSGMTFLFRDLPKQSPDINDSSTPNQRDWFIWFYPSVQYQATKKLAPYVRYSATIEHYNDAVGSGGHWTPVSANHNLEFGFDWTPTSAITVTPYTEYGAPGSGLGKPWVFSQNTFGLIGEYDFM